MSAYTSVQWVLFFFFYCFCGWVWESCYVSAKQRRWVNRGFLHGPLLPIYGSGAILILLVTLRVQGSIVLIDLIGMAAATVLEYFTGAAMESVFEVRYWDYTRQKFNLKGYICLSSTLAWGVFSILLVKFIHPPVAALLLHIPTAWAEPLALTLVTVTTVDTVQSVHAALNLREILAKLTEESEELRRLAKRAEVAAAFVGDDLRKFRERTELELLSPEDRVRAKYTRTMENHAGRLLQQEEYLRQRSGAKLDILRNITEVLENCAARLEDMKDQAGEAIAERKADITDAMENIRIREFAIRGRTSKFYGHALRILRGNPSAAAAKKYAEALESLRKMGGIRRD